MSGASAQGATEDGGEAALQTTRVPVDARGSSEAAPAPADFTAGHTCKCSEDESGVATAVRGGSCEGSEAPPERTRGTARRAVS